MTYVTVATLTGVTLGATSAWAAEPVPPPEKRPGGRDHVVDVARAATLAREIAAAVTAPAGSDAARIRDPELLRVPPIRRMRPTVPPKPAALRRWLSRL